MTSRKIIILNNRHPHDGVGRYAFSLFLTLTKLQKLSVEMFSWHHKIFRGNLKPFELIPYFLYNVFKAYSVPRNCVLYHVTNHGLLAILSERLTPSVVTVHDLFPFAIPRSAIDLFIRRTISKSLARTDRIICISESTKNDLLSFLDVNHKKVRVVYHGVNHYLFRPRDKSRARKILGLPLNKPIILHVGSKERRKNVLTLVKAFSKLLKKLPSTILIRIGNDAISTRRLIKRLGIDEHVLYLSGVSDKHLAYVYNAADLFVFPSYYEGFGMPVLEAMSSGIPVITSNIPALLEVVGDAGISLDPFDTESFAYWMSELLTNQELSKMQSEKALRRSKIFSWEHCAKQTLQVYKEVINDVF